ncbi:MAG TPA: pesticidal protein Cry7Aa [Saprospiraceae bacterium]|nr:pesticidal protein Cry7Aa [Saprospiraceae bacterium]HPI06818.1 pesticidal protein Cry7Aa [Saprospiraceae bacterium]
MKVPKLEVNKLGVILHKTDLVFENAGVLNPAVMQEGNTLHIFFRAVRKGNYSTIGYCRLEGPETVVERLDTPIIFPQGEKESHGVEDPRITKIDGIYYLTYTAYDGVNVFGSYATAETLPNGFEKRGIITPEISCENFLRLAQTKYPLNEKYLRFNGYYSHIMNMNALLWDKNVVFFPRRIGGRLFFLHRIKPDIQIAAVHDLSDLTNHYWEDYFLHFQDHIALAPKHSHEISYIGGGCPPIETEHGWLLIYHGVYDTASGYKYVACAALMDLENPGKEISRLPYALFKPEHKWELKGEVDNVCFPTGTALFDDTLYIYYGAADERIACASLSLSALISELLLNVKKHE